MPRPYWRTITTLVTLATAVVLIPAAVAEAQSAEERQLHGARDRLAAVARELRSAEETAEDAELELAEADERLAAVEAVVNDVAAALDRQRDAVAEAEDRLATVEVEASVVRARLEERAASMFKQGTVRNFDVLLSSQGAEEALARTTYLRALTLGDAATSEALSAAEVAVDAERDRLRIEEERLDAMLVEQRELLAEVERLRESRALAAASARAEVEDLATEHGDLEAESDRLEELIRERQHGAQAQVSAPSSSGYAWPMCAPMTSEYGPRWGRMHRGVDLGAGMGTPIGASKAGTVIFAGWNSGGFGNLVMIDHGDGVVTAYAHQSRVAVSNGATVGQGTTIGYVGSTGNSTGPHLHQEFRVNGTPVNPRQYLSGNPC